MKLLRDMVKTIKFATRRNPKKKENVRTLTIEMSCQTMNGKLDCFNIIMFCNAHDCHHYIQKFESWSLPFLFGFAPDRLR
jgi:hypothetical protein